MLSLLLKILFKVFLCKIWIDSEKIISYKGVARIIRLGDNFSDILRVVMRKKNFYS